MSQVLNYLNLLTEPSAVNFMQHSIIYAGFTFLIYCLFRRIYPAYFTKCISHFAGPPTWLWPIIGNAHLFKFNPADFLEQVLGLCDLHRRDKAYRMWFGPQVMIGIYTPDYVEKILSSSKLITKSFVYKFIEPWLGKGLLTSTGEKWHQRRKLLTPTFHLRILNDFIESFNDHSETMVRLLVEKVDGEPFDIFPNLTLCALDSIAETAMGVQVEAQINSDSEYIKAVYIASETVFTRARFPWYWPSVIFDRLPLGKQHNMALKMLHDYTNNVINTRKQQLEDEGLLSAGEDFGSLRGGAGGGKRRLAFLDMLLASSDNGRRVLTVDDIREEVDTFMFEGHDTTAAACSWAVHLIGAHMQIQEKIQRELDTIFGESQRAPTAEDLRNMTYLECCIKTLRLFPSVPFFGRECTEDCDLGDGRIIPKGCNITVLTFGLHRNPEIYPDPDNFIPERFTLENSVSRHPFAYIPFSAGPRNCIGQKYAMLELKVMLSYLFRKYKVVSRQLREELRPMAELITRPENGIIVQLYHREP